MTTSAKRLAEAQVVLREGNERIKQRERGAHPWQRILFVCECSDLHCTTLLKLTLREYERVRGHPNRFLIAVGHETLEVEGVVSANKRFAVVEKVGVAKAISDASDPRSRSRSASDDHSPEGARATAPSSPSACRSSERQAASPLPPRDFELRPGQSSERRGTNEAARDDVGHRVVYRPR